jgi:decaprenylphospho-beta-D-ribofuranose 2-oxidase
MANRYQSGRRMPADRGRGHPTAGASSPIEATPGEEVLGLSGWGRFPRTDSTVVSPSDISELASFLKHPRSRPIIARGMGRSYGDAALNEGGFVLSLTRLNRIESFDPALGVLRCEGGATLEALIARVLPRGFFLPVTPGTRSVTVGGAIAADVHGKNHHGSGTFSNCVEELELLTATGELLRCSRRENAAVFWATVGGMGLTGIIVRATLRLLKVESAYVRLGLQATEDFDDTVVRLERADQDSEYTIAWVDFASRGRKFGRALLMDGSHARRDELPEKIREPLALAHRSALKVPFAVPLAPKSRRLIQVFNELYFRASFAGASRLVDFDEFFYPLDGIADWNLLFGQGGFIEIQAVLPEPHAAQRVREVIDVLQSTGATPFLAALKRFGEEGSGLLSFPRKGISVNLDLPVSPGLAGVTHRLAASIVDHGGRIYLAKDAVLERDLLAPGYPRLPRFQQIINDLDPMARISSSLSRRLGLRAA